MPRYPIFVLLMCTNLCGVPDLVGFPGKRLKKQVTSRWQLTLQLLASLCLACYLCAGLLHCIVGWVYSWCIGRVSSESSTPVNRRETSVLHEPATTQTEARGLTVAASSEIPPNGNVETSQQSLSTPDQSLRHGDNGAVPENTIEHGRPAVAPATDPVPEAAQDDRSQAAAPSWRRQTWKYLQYGLAVPFVGVFIIFFGISSYLYPAEDDNAEKVVEQQSAAEEGVVDTSSANNDPDGQAQDTNLPSRSKGQEPSRHVKSAIFAVDVVLRWILRSSLMLIGRLVLGVGSLYGYTFNWAWRQVTERCPTEILVNAFGLLNFSLAALYYLVYFDAEGTSAPAWSDIFG